MSEVKGCWCVAVAAGAAPGQHGHVVRAAGGKVATTGAGYARPRRRPRRAQQPAGRTRRHRTAARGPRWSDRATRQAGVPERPGTAAQGWAGTPTMPTWAAKRSSTTCWWRRWPKNQAIRIKPG